MRHVQSSMQDMFVDAGSQQKTADRLHALKIILAPIRFITRKVFCCSTLCIMFFPTYGLILPCSPASAPSS